MKNFRFRILDFRMKLLLFLITFFILHPSSLLFAQWTNPPTAPGGVPGLTPQTITALTSNINARVPKPTNTWTSGYVVTTYDGGTTTTAVANDASGLPVETAARVAADAALSNSVVTLTGQVATIQSTMATNGQWNAQINAVSNYAAGIVGGVTNIGTGLTGNGTTTALSVNTNTIATTGFVASATSGLLGTGTAASTYSTIAALSSSGAAHNARIDTLISSATASNNFYLASNPSNYQSGAQVATNIAAQIVSNGFITGSAVSNQFASLASAQTISAVHTFTFGFFLGDLFFDWDGATLQVAGDPGQDINFDLPVYLKSGSTIPGYATTSALATATASMATGGQWNASVAGASNLAWAIGAAATSGVNGVGLVATNLHLAQGVQITNLLAATASLTSGVLSVGAVATNAQVTASNAVPWLSLTGAVNAVGITNVSNQALAGGGRTNAIIAGTWTNSAYPWITNAAFVAGYDDSENIGASRAYVTVGRSKTSDTYRGFRYNRLSQFWEDIDYSGSATNRFLTTATFSSSSYVQASEATNYVRMLIGKSTASTIGQFRDIYRETSGTSVWINVGNSTNWLRVNGVLNNFD